MIKGSVRTIFVVEDFVSYYIFWFDTKYLARFPPGLKVSCHIQTFILCLLRILIVFTTPKLRFLHRHYPLRNQIGDRGDEPFLPWRLS